MPVAPAPESPRPTARALVALAGAGNLVDAFARILVPGCSITISLFTFVGEVLLIAGLFWVAVTGTPSRRGATAAVLPARSAVARPGAG